MQIIYKKIKKKIYLMKTLKKKNLKIDDPEEEEIRNKLNGNNNSQNKYDRLFNLADSQSIEL